jgi:hypothetical protein
MSRSVYRFLRDAADRRDQYRGYRSRSDAWGRGFVKNPILVGLGGEYAYAELSSRRGYLRFVDLALRVHGDGGRDFEQCGLIVQVKTRRKGLGQRSLVKRGDRYGRIVPLACDVFVFAQWDETANESPRLLGWIWAADASRIGQFERSPVQTADHWNLRIADTLLSPMTRLIDEFEARS